MMPFESFQFMIRKVNIFHNEPLLGVPLVSGNFKQDLLDLITIDFTS